MQNLAAASESLALIVKQKARLLPVVAYYVRESGKHPYAGGMLTLLQDTILQRMQQPSYGPSLAIENLGQEALLHILQEATSQLQAPSCGAQAIHWAQHFREAPASWFSDVPFCSNGCA